MYRGVSRKAILRYSECFLSWIIIPLTLTEADVHVFFFMWGLGAVPRTSPKKPRRTAAAAVAPPSLWQKPRQRRWHEWHQRRFPQSNKLDIRDTKNVANLGRRNMKKLVRHLFSQDSMGFLAELVFQRECTNRIGKPAQYMDQFELGKRLGWTKYICGKLWKKYEHLTLSFAWKLGSYRPTRSPLRLNFRVFHGSNFQVLSVMDCVEAKSLKPSFSNQ